ncbi:MAG TPA: SLBB domain-containing protein, partial [Thermoanaerobaculia bacterium]|nr:SLBB domain-containing protein [Thermoanaerobaculia bacterium]
NLSPSWNIPIFPSDIVTVSAAKPVKISCIGEFKTPGIVEFPGDERVTLLTLIARTGGLTDNAARGKIRVKRRSPDGTIKELFFNYSRIVSGKDQDPDLESGDVVVVKESLF